MTWLRRWLLLTAAVPLLAWVLDRVRETIEERRGRTRFSGSLAQASQGLRQVGGRGRRRRRWA